MARRASKLDSGLGEGKVPCCGQSSLLGVGSFWHRIQQVGLGRAEGEMEWIYMRMGVALPGKGDLEAEKARAPGKV